ncbi:hypothetical protein JL101_035885 (plasmid) [Skermanella rosea]|uniref:hypothetical protein n=1 Tax=Skermanella rosea TaxID=1817965 RepID=UPI0019332816|nr:hypothetical protein [Skermanella rosea]UEM08034.1 hypothetical protein JL101_035885 [Skermanella rosea]
MRKNFKNDYDAPEIMEPGLFYRLRLMVKGAFILYSLAILILSAVNFGLLSQGRTLRVASISESCSLMTLPDDMVESARVMLGAE